MRYTPLIVLLIGFPLRADDLGLKAPPGFKVTLWADHTLANDIYTLCLDEKGRAVVSGPGCIRMLEDTDGDGKADKATDIAETKTGAMGLCYYQYPTDCYRFVTSRDSMIHDRILKWRGQDETLEKIALDNWKFGEHGGHALKVGPDGSLYAVAGNNSIEDAFKQGRESLVPQVQAGFIARFRAFPVTHPEVIAHGFRNPYDFDFTPYGDIITFDSDSERDSGLPWYTPTRVYHVMPGAHHGWRLPGGMRSLAKRDYYPDTVPMLADMGRGSPTGVCCYRHIQFPEHYRGGVFLLDWTFGRVHYMPLIPEGSSYKPLKPEVFIESTGSNGFAPTAARVAPDGSLFISIGGRGTRGAVYRVEYQIDGKPVTPQPEPKNEIDKVLDAPQPLEAWSMAKWMPLLEKIKTQDIVAVGLDENETDARRIRAIEILVQKGERFPDEAIYKLAKSRSPQVRARHAWAAWYHIWGYRFFAQLVELADDDDPRVASNAINQIANYFSIAPDIDLKREKGVASAVAFEAVVRWLGHDDRRVRLAASRIVERITPARWQTLEKELGNDGTSRAIVSFICGSSSRTGSNAIATGSLLSLATASVQRAKTIDEKRDAIRAIMLALGDWNIDKPAVEVFAAYSLKTSPDKRPGFHRLLMRPVVEGLRADFPSTDERFNIEASRLFAMLEVDDPAIIRKVASQITETSHPTRDFHYLAVLARLGPLRDDTHSAAIADSLLCLPKKLVDQKVSIESNWSPRFAELIGELVRVQPKLDEVLAAHPDLAQPGNVVVASKLKGVPRREAAKRLLVAVRENADYPLTSELVDMLAELPAANVLPVFRARWSDRSMREALVKHLAAKPIEDDRSKFLESLESGNRDTVNACLQALETIPRDDSAKNLIPVFARLRQSFSEPKEAALRKRLLALIERQSAHQFVVIESAIDAAALATAYRTIFAWFEKTHPNEAKLLTTNAEDEEALRKMLSSVKWDAGDFDRGRKLFVGRGCQTCHGGNARLGPDLAGVGKRLNRDDLLTSIVNPSRDVSPAYRLTNIDTKDGKRTSGVIVYDSNEMLLVQTGPAETKRILAADVESRLPSAKSLMPDGLLKGIKPEELADLFAYLAKQ